MNFAICRLLALFFAGVLDQLFADPRVSWHPICLIGNLISGIERNTRRLFSKTKRGEHLAGFFLVVLVLMAVEVPFVLLYGLYRLHWVAGVAAESMLLFFAFAEKSLERESLAVKTALESDLDAGRKAVSMIVGRDTAELTGEGVIKAAVETVAENASDGVIAPIFYACLGGAGLAYLYKAVNTMDSMVGYRNENYQYYGTAAAKLDDILNFIPARLTAGLMIVASCLYKRLPTQPLSHVVSVFRRDRFAHKSPNSAQTESVMAGALGVELAGPASYFGILHQKPTIGDGLRPIENEDIRRAVLLMRLTAVLGWGLALLVLLCYTLYSVFF
jgi:adenosylcobinamide-phosphate synthase